MPVSCAGQYGRERHDSPGAACTPPAGVYYEQGKLAEAIQTYQEAIAREPNFPEAYNNLGNALREAGRNDEAIACYTMCIQLQFNRPQHAQLSRAMQANPQMAAVQQAQRLGVAYNNLGGILKMQVCACWACCATCAAGLGCMTLMCSQSLVHGASAARRLGALQQGARGCRGAAQAAMCSHLPPVHDGAAPPCLWQHLSEGWPGRCYMAAQVK